MHQIRFDQGFATNPAGGTLAGLWAQLLRGEEEREGMGMERVGQEEGRSGRGGK